MPDRGQVLFNRRSRSGEAYSLYVGCDVERPDVRDRDYPLPLAPGEESDHGAGIGPPGIAVADKRRRMGPLDERRALE